MIFSLPTNMMNLGEMPDRRDWIRRLDRTIADIAARWKLELGPPYQPGGACSWVAPATDRSGTPLVLKVGWRHEEAADEPAGLLAWADHGAVRLVATEQSDDTSVLLLERCEPGTQLSEAAAEADQDVIVAASLRRLWSAPTDNYPFRPLSAMCDTWADSFERRCAGNPDAVAPELAERAITAFRTLPASAPTTVLLSTDLHAGNILAATRSPWLVIDPKPYLGDPTYDAVQHMLNCTGRLREDPVGLATRMADLLDLDPDRLIEWLLARCAQESIGQPGFGTVAMRLAGRR